jgi:hypothetical protein
MHYQISRPQRIGSHLEASFACRWLVLLLIFAFSIPTPGHAGSVDRAANDAAHCDGANASNHDVPGGVCGSTHDGVAHGHTCCIGPSCAPCVPAATGNIPILSDVESSSASPWPPHSGNRLYLPFRPPRPLPNA